MTTFPKIKWSFLVLLALFPITFITTALVVGHNRGPYWLGPNLDPEYAYLLNSLNILNLKAPTHTDHPGTPLQLLGSLVITVLYIFRYLTGIVNTNLFQDAIEESELYLKGINLVLLLLATGSVFLVGLTALRWSNNLFVSMSSQSSLFLLTPLNVANRVSPEPLLFSISQGIIVVFLIYLYSSKKERSLQLAIWLGILFGLGLATKVTFLPLIASFLILPKTSQRILAIVSSFLSFLIVTLPIISRYPIIYSWLYSILTHTGAYGSGEMGFIDFNTVWTSFKQWILEEPFYFFIVLTSLFIYIFSYFLSIWNVDKFSQENGLTSYKKFRRVLGCTVLIALLQMVITLKQPLFIRYMTPSISLSGIMIVAQLVLISSLLRRRFLIKLFYSTLLSALVLLCCFNIKAHLSLISTTYKSYFEEIQKIQFLLTTTYKECAQVNYYPASSQEFALAFGNIFANNNFSDLLETLYPRFFNYNLLDHSYSSFKESVQVADLLQYNCVTFQGPPFDSPGYEKHLPSFPLKLIFQGKEALYVVKESP